MTVMLGNVGQIFILDTFVASASGISLKDYMMNKHNWTEQQFKEYKGYYLSLMCNKDFQAAFEAFNPAALTPS